MRSLFFLLNFFLFLSPIYSETIFEQSPINFGTIAITDNTSPRTLRVRYTGQVIRDPEILIISSPSPAEYLLTGFPPNKALTITVTNITGFLFSPYASVLNEKFTISNFDFFVPGASTNASGEFSFFLGATLTTSGSGTYSDNTYLGTLNINVAY